MRFDTLVRTGHLSQRLIRVINFCVTLIPFRPCGVRVRADCSKKVLEELVFPGPSSRGVPDTDGSSRIFGRVRAVRRLVRCLGTPG